MKVFVFLALTCLVVVSAQRLGFNDAACVQQTEADVTAINAYKRNRVYDQNDHKLKCMLTCAFSKFGVLNENGDFSAQKMVEQIMKEDDSSEEDQTKVSNLLDRFKICDNSKIVGDYCERGFFAVDCVYGMN